VNFRYIYKYYLEAKFLDNMYQLKYQSEYTIGNIAQVCGQESNTAMRWTRVPYLLWDYTLCNIYHSAYA